MRFGFLALRSMWTMLALAGAVPSASAQNPSAPRTWALTHVTVIDVVSGRAVPDRTVVIAGDRIREVGEFQRVRIPEGAPTIEARGQFLIPGLWDMHVHFGDAGDALFPLLLANGVTSVREMGGDGERALALRQRVRSGELTGPRIASAGMILESPRFIQLVERITKVSYTGKRIGVGTPADAAAAVRTIAGTGADFVKIRTSASRDVYLAIAAEAKRAGLTLVGHLPDGINPLDASDAGQRSIEHGLVMLDSIPEPRLEEIANRFIRNDTHLVPTLIAGVGYRHTPDSVVLAIIADSTGQLDPRRAYVPRSMVDFWQRQMDLKRYEGPVDWAAVKRNNQRIFRALHQAGVQIMAGTDMAAPLSWPGSGLHDELELLVRDIGLTPVEALQAATVIPARFMRQGTTLGTVDGGKLADLVLLRANPLTDIRNTRQIAGVVIGGRLLGGPEIEAMLRQAAADAPSR